MRPLRFLPALRENRRARLCVLCGFLFCFACTGRMLTWRCHFLTALHKIFSYFKCMNENDLSYKIVGIALKLHKNIGPGLLESAYENALAYDLREMGLEVKQQVPMPFMYKEMRMDLGYRIDLLIENSLS